MIINMGHNLKQSNRSLYGVISNDIECVICLESKIPVYPKFDCLVNHYYCDSCFNIYIENLLKNNKEVVCAYCKCANPIDTNVKRFIDLKEQEFYKLFIDVFNVRLLIDELDFIYDTI